MNRLAGIAVLDVGLVLFIWGLRASDSLGSGLSGLLRGAPTEKTFWLLLGGGLLIAAGLGSILVPSRNTSADRTGPHEPVGRFSRVPEGKYD